MALASAIILLATSAAAAAPGDHRWFETYSGGRDRDEAVAVATNGDGCPIVVGITNASYENDDICWRSYLPSGTMRWSNPIRYWDGVGRHESVAGLVVDSPRDYVYVAGTTESADGDTDYVVLKLRDPAGITFSGGSRVWAQTFDAAPGGDERARAIARDKHGDVYVAGSSQRSDGSWDLHIAKYRADGTLAWARRHNNGGSRYDGGRAVAVRGDSVFVAGISTRRRGDDDIVLVKYSLGGSRRWVRYYDDPLHRSAEVMAMALTSSSVYVCGRGKYTSASDGDALLLKYGHDGRRKWVRYTAGSGDDWDFWNDVAVDNKARVHVTGNCTRRNSGEDIVTRLYSPSGRRLWQRVFKTNDTDWGLAVAVDSSRRTYVCGIRTLSGDEDGVVIKYGTGGATLWKTTYADPANFPDEHEGGAEWLCDVAVAGENVYAVGRQRVNHGGVVDPDFLTLAIWR